MKKILRVINWAFLGLCAFIVLSFLLGGEEMNEANSSLAALLVVLALTGMVWVPVGFVAAVWSLILEYRAQSVLWRQPALYAFVITLLLFWLMFS